jgi:acetoacetyl-CoA reductase/3-oxoacyl-[acyl-carrier protein] reductase
MEGSSHKRVITISSGLGSIHNVLAYNGGTANPGGIGSYRCSKAGINMMNRVFAAELGEKGATCIALSPGWVQTDQVR